MPPAQAACGCADAVPDAAPVVQLTTTGGAAAP
jgi:hypothetical protein